MIFNQTGFRRQGTRMVPVSHHNSNQTSAVSEERRKGRLTSEERELVESIKFDVKPERSRFGLRREVDVQATKPAPKVVDVPVQKTAPAIVVAKPERKLTAVERQVLVERLHRAVSETRMISNAGRTSGMHQPRRKRR
ncbi:hypothetical protein HYV73_00205 [Candidatus Uhrbacteria bacterium]|nr:hypothetical protein [Candidatus Uhrbacteria bacterium]